MSYHIEFDRSDLDQFDPLVREALLRIASAQHQARENARLPFRGVELKRGADRMTPEDYERRDASQEAPGGGRMQPDLVEGQVPWRKPT